MTDRLLIDGNNLLHHMSGSVDEGAQRLLLARLRGALPENAHATIMFDGHAAAGTPRRERVAKNLDIQHSAALTADEALLNLLRDMSGLDRAATVLVTDDRELIDKARRVGARTQRLAWLEELLKGHRGGPGAIGAGRPKRPQPSQPPASAQQDDQRRPWRPGRGATTKRGNPRRGRPPMSGR